MIDPAFTLEKKIAIVVGAANGIGRATALAYAAAGARVACADIEEPGAKTTAAEIEAGGGEALPVRLDVTDGASCRDAVAATAQRFGGLDVLMYGAADSDRTATVLEMDEAAWDRVIRINLTGAFLMVKAAIPAMITRGGGSIILIASQLGRVASPGRPAYCATKGALIQLAKVLAADHAAQGIRANTISPGAIETRRMLRRWKDMDEARKMMGPNGLTRTCLARPPRKDRDLAVLSGERLPRRSVKIQTVGAGDLRGQAERGRAGAWAHDLARLVHVLPAPEHPPGLDRARRDRVGADTLGRVIGGEHLRELDRPPLVAQYAGAPG